MTFEEHEKFINGIACEVDNLKMILDLIHKNISIYPVHTQLEFLEFINIVIMDAWRDSLNKDNSFLNNFDSGDKIEI